MRPSCSRSNGIVAYVSCVFTTDPKPSGSEVCHGVPLVVDGGWGGERGWFRTEIPCETLNCVRVVGRPELINETIPIESWVGKSLTNRSQEETVPTV